MILYQHSIIIVMENFPPGQYHLEHGEIPVLLRKR